MDERFPEAALPRIEVRESPEGFCLLADLPGLSKENVELTVEGDVLTIACERKAPESPESHTWHIAERAYGSFARSFKLPFVPDAARVTADLQNGVLTVQVPKAAAQERGRRIPIGAARPMQLEKAATGDEAFSASAESESQRAIDKAAAREPQGVSS
jgi:HSP20 family protein